MCLHPSVGGHSERPRQDKAMFFSLTSELHFPFPGAGKLRPYCRLELKIQNDIQYFKKFSSFQPCWGLTV